MRKKINNDVFFNVEFKFLADEIATHTDMSDKDKIMLQYLDDKQLKKLYKKAYKQSLKPETERFSEKIYMPKLHHQKVANFAAPVEILDYVGTPHIVGSVKQPLAYTELESFNPKDYLKNKEQKRIDKIKKALGVIDVHGVVQRQKALKTRHINSVLKTKVFNPVWQSNGHQHRHIPLCSKQICFQFFDPTFIPIFSMFTFPNNRPSMSP